MNGEINIAASVPCRGTTLLGGAVHRPTAKKKKKKDWSLIKILLDMISNDFYNDSIKGIVGYSTR